MYSDEKLKLMQAIQAVATTAASSLAKENKLRASNAQLKKRVPALEAANREMLTLLRTMRDNHRCEGGCGWCSQYTKAIDMHLRRAAAP